MHGVRIEDERDIEQLSRTRLLPVRPAMNFGGNFAPRSRGPSSNASRVGSSGSAFCPAATSGTAIKYVAAHWDGLCVFLDEPAVPIDNNSVERGFRGPALGRNNFYGSHSRRGTEVAAIMYSLVESAKLNGVDPKRYMKLALKAALDGKRIPLPHEIAATA